jgi:hypothetical protein
LADATCDPSETPVVGALMARAPAVRVKDAGVAAPAGAGNSAIGAASAVNALATTNIIRDLPGPISLVKCFIASSLLLENSTTVSGGYIKRYRRLSRTS